MPGSPEHEPETAEPRLDSWKEIASYLRRGIRTVQRWEREEGLPVHRLDHAKRGSVYAIRNELTAWWESRRRRNTLPASTDQAERPETKSQPGLEHVTRTSAATFWPSLSSDARMIVYVSDAGKDGESPQVWLQQIGGAAVQLTSGQIDCAEPTFSADDTRVIFTATGESTRSVYEMPALGGKPRVLKRAARNARFSPDGQWLAYLTLEAAGSIRLLPAAGGKERRLAEGLVDVETATWSPDSRHLMVVGHPDASVELDCWVVPIDGAPPVDTRVLQRARQQGFVVISTSHAWAGDSIFFSAAWRQGVHVWRQRIAPGTFESIGAPEPMTPGAEMAFFPTAARNRLAFVGIHSDTNIWSIALDAASGTPYGPLRRLTRGPGIVGHLTSSQDGRALAYFAVRTLRGELHVRNLESGSETIVEGDPAFNPGFPTISPGGEQIAYSALVPGPPLQRPVLIASLVDGKSRLVRDDCGGRPRQWLDEQTLLVETFGSGLNSFFLLDTRDGSQRPLLSAAERKVSNPRISPDGRWLAFDAMPPGGSPEVAVAPIGRGTPVQESEWTLIREPASHPFWSRDGRLLYYLAMFPNVDIRSRILARGFDTSTGRVEDRPTDILTLREMIVPAMVTGTAPIVAPDQIIFVLGDFRGDVWIREI